MAAANNNIDPDPEALPGNNNNEGLSNENNNRETTAEREAREQREQNEHTRINIEMAEGVNELQNPLIFKYSGEPLILTAGNDTLKPIGVSNNTLLYDFLTDKIDQSILDVLNTIPGIDSPLQKINTLVSQQSISSHDVQEFNNLTINIEGREANYLTTGNGTEIMKITSDFPIKLSEIRIPNPQNIEQIKTSKEDKTITAFKTKILQYSAGINSIEQLKKLIFDVFSICNILNFYGYVMPIQLVYNYNDRPLFIAQIKFIYINPFLHRNHAMILQYKMMSEMLQSGGMKTLSKLKNKTRKNKHDHSHSKNNKKTNNKYKGKNKSKKSKNNTKHTKHN